MISSRRGRLSALSLARQRQCLTDTEAKLVSAIKDSIDRGDPVDVDEHFIAAETPRMNAMEMSSKLAHPLTNK
jgi:hypothetical protein